MPSPNIEEIIWQAPEFQYRHKELEWYWLSIIAAGILFLFALWQKNLLFAIFIVIAEIMLIVWANELPKNLQFKINKNGVQIGGLKSYYFEELGGFHICEKEGGWGELVLKTRNKLHAYVKILVFNKDIPEIKKFLKEKLPEMEYQESLSDHLGRRIGF